MEPYGNDGRWRSEIGSDKRAIVEKAAEYGYRRRTGVVENGKLVETQAN